MNFQNPFPGAQCTPELLNRWSTNQEILYRNMPHDKVDWSSLAKEWIEMQQTTILQHHQHNVLMNEMQMLQQHQQANEVLLGQNMPYMQMNNPNPSQFNLPFIQNHPSFSTQRPIQNQFHQNSSHNIPQPPLALLHQQQMRMNAPFVHETFANHLDSAPPPFNQHLHGTPLIPRLNTPVTQTNFAPHKLPPPPPPPLPLPPHQIPAVGHQQLTLSARKEPPLLPPFEARNSFNFDRNEHFKQTQSNTNINFNRNTSSNYDDEASKRMLDRNIFEDRHVENMTRSNSDDNHMKSAIPFTEKSRTRSPINQQFHSNQPQINRINHQITNQFNNDCTKDDNSPTDESSQTEVTTKRKKLLPEWIRIGLERMEREKQKKLENEENLLKKAKEEQIRKELELDEDDNVIDGNENDQESTKKNNKLLEEPKKLFSTSSSLNQKTFADMFLVKKTKDYYYENEEERDKELILRTKRVLTNILMEVTDSLVKNVASKCIQEAKIQKFAALSKQLAKPQPIVGSGLGIVSQYYSSDSDNNDSQDNVTDGQKKNSRNKSQNDRIKSKDHHSSRRTSRSKDRRSHSRHRSRSKDRKKNSHKSRDSHRLRSKERRFSYSSDESNERSKKNSRRSSADRKLSSTDSSLKRRSRSRERKRSKDYSKSKSSSRRSRSRSRDRSDNYKKESLSRNKESDRSHSQRSRSKNKHDSTSSKKN